MPTVFATAPSDNEDYFSFLISEYCPNKFAKLLFYSLEAQMFNNSQHQTLVAHTFAVLSIAVLRHATLFPIDKIYTHETRPMAIH